MIARLCAVGYRYPAATGPALRDVSLEVEDGSLQLLAGPSAGGKSTLLRLFNGLVPQFHGGTLSGRVCVGGLEPATTPARRMAMTAGMVFQEPEAQAITDVVEDEIAFGMEQQGVPRDEMVRRLASLYEWFALGHLRQRRLSTLSGGERQRVAIAAVLAMQPRVLLLDEPTSQLDHGGAAAVSDAIEVARRQLGVTALIAEHRLARLLPSASRVLHVVAGEVAARTPRDAAPLLEAPPAAVELGLRLRRDPVPLSLAEAEGRFAGARVTLPGPSASPGEVLLAVDDLRVEYGGMPALAGASLSLREGEIVALTGANGSGKTTLFRAIAGLAPVQRGRVVLGGRVAPASVGARTAVAALLPQDPAYVFFRERVADEIRDSLRNRGLPAGPAAVDGVLRHWEIERLADRNPRDVSVGQQQRIALATMLAHEPPAWLLDEPTRGADGPAKAWLARRLRAHAAQGGAAIVATHDVEAAARFATRVIGLAGGAIQFDLPVRVAFGAHGPLPTDTARLVPGAIVPEEVEPA